MKHYKNLDDILKNWGRSKEKLPANNEALKSEILSRAPIPQLSKHVTLPRKSFMPWLSLGFATLSIFVFVWGSVGSRIDIYSGRGVMGVSGGMSVAEKSFNSADTSLWYPGPRYGVPVTDTREFLKTYYNATLRTRHASETGSKVEIIIRGSGGRVDSSSLGEDNGYISFSLPSDKFAIFRDQIKGLVLAKLFTENISSENLLPQKQSIEERQKEAKTSLANLKKEQSELIRNHLEAQKNLPESERQAENIMYQNNFALLEKRIQSAQYQLSSLGKEDKNFTENIYTVNGSISLQKTSLWGIADLYVPGPILAWLLAIAAVLIYWRYHISSRIYLPY